MKNLKEKIKIVFTLEDQDVLDEDDAKLLLLIRETGSILSASKILNIPYTRAWEHILKMEKLLGVRIIDSKRGGRGGGGTKLTREGIKLLEKYMRSYRKFFGKDLKIKGVGLDETLKNLIYIGSDDVLMKEIINLLKREGFKIESYYLGSLNGIASLILGESDFTGVHLYDPVEDEYNIPYIEKYASAYPFTLLKGYHRLQGFITRERFSLDEIISRLFSRKLRFVNRNLGSGTRILIDHVLNRYREKMGLKSGLKDLIIGYEVSVSTHLEVAAKIAEGEADVGIGIKPSANYYNLNFIPIKWERFDFIVRNSKKTEMFIKKFSKLLKGDSFKNLIGKFDGYKVDEEIGDIVYI